MALKRKNLACNGDEPPQKYRRGLNDEQHNAPSSDPFGDETSTGKPVKAPVADRRTVRHFVCGFAGCDYTVDRQTKMDNHRRTHTGERPFACTRDGCDKAYARKDKLKHHMKYGHGEAAPRPHVCTWPGCKKTYQTKQHLDNHLEAHENKFYCTGFGDCNEVFRKQKTLDDHIAIKHMQKRPYPCTHVDAKTGERCTKEYDVEGELKKHVNNTHAVKEVFYICLMCPAPGTELEVCETEEGLVHRAKEGLRFDTYLEMQAHNREAHPPGCPQCGKTFKSPSSLQTHIDTVHGNPDRIPCPRPGCNTLFKAVRTLNAHILNVHDKPKRFQCVATAFADSKKPEMKAWDGKDACGAFYSSRNILEQHVRREHLHGKNRKETRRQAKARAKVPARPEPSTLQLLTGHGYDEGKTVHCTERGCDHRFFRDYDLRRHLWGVHKLDEHEIEEKILERNALEGREFWIAGDDYQYEDADFESSIPQSPDSNYNPITPGDMDYQLAENVGPYFHQGGFDALKQSVAEAEEEAEMDGMMGLDSLQTWNTQHGLPAA